MNSASLQLHPHPLLPRSCLFHSLTFPVWPLRFLKLQLCYLDSVTLFKNFKFISFCDNCITLIACPKVVCWKAEWFNMNHDKPHISHSVNMQLIEAIYQILHSSLLNFTLVLAYLWKPVKIEILILSSIIKISITLKHLPFIPSSKLIKILKTMKLCKDSVVFAC